MNTPTQTNRTAPVRLGIIGCGGAMARFHESYLAGVQGLTYAAATGRRPESVKESVDAHGCTGFDSAEQMIASGAVDAVLIATPHTTHPAFAELAFEHGLHVLVEKPLAVTALEAQGTIDAYEAARQKHPSLVFAGMFQQRTFPQWRHVKRLCTDGSIGDLMRVSWTITDWFRTQTYYDAGGWRATWKGEGGGVLLNQCPHNLDLLCWFVGQPSRVNAIAELGKYHHVEVEDDVTALLQWQCGATGTFITSTGQTPGINRLEIAGNHGTVIAEKKPGASEHTVTYYAAQEPVRDFTANCPERFDEVAVETFITQPSVVEGQDKRPPHQRIMQNFVDAIQNGTGQDNLLTPAPEGLLGLELGNALLLSGLDQTPIDLPMPATGERSRQQYADRIKHLAETSTFVRNEVKASSADMSASF
ncbi:Gfo/Idh/MocA family oxidoreductase [Phycisphaeraceae bacterium D3-23]